MTNLEQGTRVRLTIHSIGDRSELVTGTVVGYTRRGDQHIVRTESGHGDVVASSDDLEVLS